MQYGNGSETDFDNEIFHFDPSTIPPEVIMAPFALLTLVSFLLATRYGGNFMYIIPATGLLEVVGYLTRLLTITEQTLMPYVISSLFILIAPIFLALVNYIVASRLLHVVGKPVKVAYWYLRPEIIARFFFYSDLTCFVIQCTGGGMLAITDETIVTIGSDIMLFGLGIQLMFFSAFIYVFHIISTDPEYGLRDVPSLKQVFIGVRITIGLVFMRNVYRVIEYAFGFAGPVAATQWTFYVFESTVITFAFCFYCIFHFGRLLECKSDNPKWITEFHELKVRDENKQNEADAKVSSTTSNDVV
jgi:hypothetical protein